MTLPRITPAPQHRDVLEDDSDVTAVSDRRLLLRAVNATLRLDAAVGKLMAEVGTTAKELGQVRAWMPSVDEKLAKLLDHDAKVRAELASIPDAIEEATSPDALAKVNAELEDRARLAASKAREKWLRELAGNAVKVCSGAGALEVCKWILTHHW